MGLSDEHRRTIAKRIDKAGLSITELASCADVQRAWLSRWLGRGEGNPTLATLDRIYAALKQLT